MASYLYVICDEEEDGPCKVGITDKPASRLRAIQTGHYRQLKFAELWEIEARELAGYFEKRIHEYLLPYRLAGEWFDLPPLGLVHRADLMMTCARHVATGDGEPFSHALIHSNRATSAGEML